MNRATQLSATGDFIVCRFDHPADLLHCDPEREVAEHWSLAFVETGSFQVAFEHGPVHLGEGSLLLTRPGQEFTCYHGTACPDDVCLSIRIQPDAIAGMVDPWYRPEGSVHRQVSARLAHVRRRLTAATTLGDDFETERWAIAALNALVEAIASRRPRGWYVVGTADLDAVIATCRAIESHPAMPLSVADRARSVAMTSARLTHAFRRYLGISPHQYVVRWRLARAAESLNAGLGVSETCYEAGFENLSHFCRSFHRSLGSRPSQWRGLSLTERRRKVQAMLAGDP